MTLKRNGVRAALLALAVLATLGFAPAPRIDYTLTPLLEDGALTAVQVDIDFRGRESGQTVLDLPDSWGGEDELYRTVQDLTVTGARVADGPGPAQRVLQHRPFARIHVRYRIVQDWPGELRAGSGRNPYRAVIQPTYFQFIGYAALAAPEIEESSPVRFRVQRLPRGWTFASDLEHRGLALRDVQQSVTAAGDYRIVYGADRNIRVAIRGQWTFSDEAITTEVNEIVGAQRRFWGDPSTPYLVTVTQTAAPEDYRSLGGTGLGDAFAFYATPNSERGRITRVLAHEGLHTWIPGALGGMPDGDDERLVYWFSEGFTDFYTGRLLVRESVWTPAEFAQDFNEMLRAYQGSAARNAPNARIGEAFWTDANVRQLPYQRGRLLASVWDARLRAGGHSLDDIMRDMRRRAVSGESQPVDQAFQAIAGEHGLTLGDDVAHYVERGDTVVLPEDLFAPCGAIVTRELPNFHRGFDIEATQANNNVIAGVNRAGPAYAAGMRDGMTLIRRTGGEIGDATQAITYLVRDGETERSITYVPRAPGTFTQQQFVLAEPLEGETLAQCRRVLGGD